MSGEYVEQIARMTHWEYPEAVERFGRQLEALGIAEQLKRRGAVDGDLVMVDQYDFEFSPGMTNPYIPRELLERDLMFETRGAEQDDELEDMPWRPFREGGFLDVDVDELVGFNGAEWDLLEEEEQFEEDDFVFADDEVWTSS